MFIGSSHLNIQLYVPFKDFSLIDICTNRKTYLSLETPCRSLTINWSGSKSMPIDKNWVQFHTNLIFQPPIHHHFRTSPSPKSVSKKQHSFNKVVFSWEFLENLIVTYYKKVPNICQNWSRIKLSLSQYKKRFKFLS